MSNEEDFVARLAYDSVLKNDLWLIIHKYAERWEMKPNHPVFRIRKPIYLSDANELYDVGMFVMFSTVNLFGLVIPNIVEYNATFYPKPLSL